MKRTLYLTALIAGMLNGAATGEFHPIVIASTPASVNNNMIHVGLAKTVPAALSSPVGMIYVMLNDNPEGINSLGQDPAVVAQTTVYSNTVQANKTLQILTANAVQLVETEGPEAARIIALTLFGAKYGRLLKKLVQADIPGLKLRPTLPATIEKNTSVTLDAKQTVCLQAAQLALGGLNLQEQWEIDPKTFEIMFSHYMPPSYLTLQPVWPNSSDEEADEVAPQPAQAKSWFWPFR